MRDSDGWYYPPLHWEVSESATSDGEVKFQIHRGAIRQIPSKKVKPPSWMEKLCGITYEQKVQKARTKINAECAQLNAAIDRARSLVQNEEEA
jgi:hypothetical protein